jgi:hypothetical protein
VPRANQAAPETPAHFYNFVIPILQLYRQQL